MKFTKLIMPVCMIASVLVLQAAPPVGYYDSAQGKTGQALRLALHGIIQSGHAVLPYDSSTRTDTVDALKVLDEDPQNTNNVILIYARRSDGKTNYPSRWNREHLWPESYGAASGMPRSDLFNMPAGGCPREQRTRE